MDETKDLAALVTDPENRRAHPARNLDMVQRSLTDVGAARSIVIDEDDVILAGNGVTAAALAAGITTVRVIDSAGDELIAVRRRGLTALQKRALALYDNRTSELAVWNNDQLDADAAAGLDFRPFWTEAEEAELLRRVPTFGPVSAEEQGRLDAQHPITCPHCGAQFVQQR
jgi:hypothetical protein